MLSACSSGNDIILQSRFRLQSILGMHGLEMIVLVIIVLLFFRINLSDMGNFALPNAKDSTFALPNAKIPTCWYLLRWVTQIFRGT